MNFVPLRNIFIYSSNPCKELGLTSKVLLYSFITSHAIRVDTRLYIYDAENSIVYFFDGYELRHLYAQEKSLQGFSKKIFCENKLYPGVKIYSLDIIKTILPIQDLYVIMRKTVGETRIHRTLNKIITSIGIIDTETLSLYNNYISGDSISISTDSKVIFINQAHYILDNYVGGWIRRYGTIQRAERFK